MIICLQLPYFLFYMQVVMLYIIVSRKGIVMDINQNLLSNLSIRDREFLMRIYAEGLEKYEKRIRAINFVDKQHVLDAGCGFGQWSMALAKYNRKIEAIELVPERVTFCQKLFMQNGIENISIQEGTIEKLPYEDSVFDIIWCYSVSYMTNWKISIRELLRTLKGGGKLYVCTNDVGWYYNMMINEPNKTVDYNPRENAIKAFINEWRYNNAGENFIGERVMRSRDVQRELQNYNVQILSWCGEGKSILNDSYVDKISPFFCETYFDEIGVYEFIVTRGNVL